MKQTAAFIRHEWLLARRSNRYRLAVLFYVALCTAPAVLVASYQDRGEIVYGPATFVDLLSLSQPFLTVILMLLLGADGIVREQRQRSWTVLALNGMTNAGYLLRRWVALLAVTLPWVFLPLAATVALAAMAGIPPEELLPFLPVWALRTFPPALAAAALALGLGTLAGGLFMAVALFGLGTLILSPLLDRLMVPAGMRWWGYGEWLGYHDFEFLAFALPSAMVDGRAGIWPSGDIPVAVEAAVEYLAARGAVGFGVSFLLLGLAAFFLRRTVADVPPWTVSPKHPLRSFLSVINRLRQRFRPEPRPAPADFALLALGLGILGLAVSWKIDRHHHYLALAGERYAAEIAEEPSPTPPELAVEAVRVSGRLEASGRVATTVEMTVRAAAPTETIGADHLAFTLDPGLTVRSLAADQGRATVSFRAWDRLAVTLEPAPAAGEERTLRFELEGVPATYEFRVLGYGKESFASRFQRLEKARFARDLGDLTHSSAQPAVGEHRLELPAHQLLPLPRSTPWGLTKREGSQLSTGMEVRDEDRPTMARLELDLSGPPGLTLTSSCGGLAAAGERLVDACSLVLGDLRVMGADLAVVEADPPLRFAVLGLHRRAAEFHRPAVEQAARLSAQAWPGEVELPAVTLLEGTDPPRPRSAIRTLGRGYWMDLQYFPLESFGHLALLPEFQLLMRRPIAPETLVGRTLGSRLLARRPLAAEQREVLRFVLEHLVQRRLGLSQTDGAVIFPQQNPEAPTLQLWPRWRWDFNAAVRARAVLNYLIYRVGEERFYALVERFLNRGAEGVREPGTLRELLELTAETGLDVDRFWSDYLEGQALPDPALRGVEFRRSGTGWRVTGEVHNEGTGEVRCPLLLATDLSPRERMVTIPDGGTVAFAMETPYRPQAVVLDPRGRCLRFQPMAAGERLRVEFAQ